MIIVTVFLVHFSNLSLDDEEENFDWAFFVVDNNVNCSENTYPKHGYHLL